MLLKPVVKVSLARPTHLFHELAVGCRSGDYATGCLCIASVMLGWEMRFEPTESVSWVARAGNQPTALNTLVDPCARNVESGVGNSWRLEDRYRPSDARLLPNGVPAEAVEADVRKPIGEC